jgi:hypothetical protein
MSADHIALILSEHLLLTNFEPLRKNVLYDRIRKLCHDPNLSKFSSGQLSFETREIAQVPLGKLAVHLS